MCKKRCFKKWEFSEMDIFKMSKMLFCDFFLSPFLTKKKSYLDKCKHF